MLVVEFERETIDEIEAIAVELEADMRKSGFGYHFSIVRGKDVGKVWALRKSGLGLLSNIPGDKKAEAIIDEAFGRSKKE